jgi:hypothetical protein
MIRKLIISLASAAAVASLALSGGAASASAVPQITPGCSHGTLAGSCGTQVTSSSPALGLAVTAARVGQPVIGKSDLTTSATDWFWHTAPSGNKIATFAPGGRRGTLCMRQAGVGAPITLGTCNGRAFQQWIFSDSGAGAPGTFTGTWTNAATGDSIEATTQGRAVIPVTITDPAAAPLKAQFTFRTVLIPA